MQTIPLIEQKTFAIYDGLESGPALPALCHQLLAEQRHTWEELREGYEALKAISSRLLPCHGFSVLLQFNPRRIVSSGARTDPRSIAERPCFLCVNHLPAAQMGILYRQSFLILCNPRPIFAQHYTIAHLRHLPQDLSSSLSVFLELSQDVGPDFTVFYNGPRCGASAPDHLHFQMIPAGILPIEKDCLDSEICPYVKRRDGVALFRAKGLGREVLLMEGDDRNRVEEALRSAFGALSRFGGTGEEPMVNILCTVMEKKWRVIIFPRRRHRPDAFYLEGDRQVLITPAAVEMAGLVVAPLERDYLRLDAALMEGIYRDVTQEAQAIDEMMAVV